VFGQGCFILRNSHVGIVATMEILKLALLPCLIFILVPRLGVMGASLSVGISILTTALLRIALVRKKVAELGLRQAVKDLFVFGGITVVSLFPVTGLAPVAWVLSIRFSGLLTEKNLLELVNRLRSRISDHDT